MGARRRTRPESARKRAEQLREAKRRQRARERARGLAHVQLVLPAAIAERLAVARRDPRFVERLGEFLDGQVVRIADHPVLADIAWNVTAEYLPAPEAFALYERNWRYVDPKTMTPGEAELVEKLARAFGGGILHV